MEIIVTLQLQVEHHITKCSVAGVVAELEEHTQAEVMVEQQQEQQQQEQQQRQHEKQRKKQKERKR